MTALSLKQGTYARDFNSGGNADQQDTCIPRFFKEAEQIIVDGNPVWQDVEMVEIIMPGNALTKPIQRVGDTQRARWPKAYTAFKANEEMPLEGTPIEEWPVLTRAMVMQLKSLEFRTVEDIAKMNEHAIQRIGMGGRELKMKAVAYIDSAKSAAITNQAIENAAKYERLYHETQGQLQRNNEQLAMLGDQMRQMQMNQQMASQNTASTPNVVAFQPAPAPSAVSPFAALAVRGVVDRAADNRAEFAAFQKTDVQAPVETPQANIDLQIPAKKRGRKSNAEKAAEAAALAAQG